MSAVARTVGRWLGLAAAPTFAIMALATTMGGGSDAMICGAANPLGGMAPMYMLMGVFHLSPWLRPAAPHSP